MPLLRIEPTESEIRDYLLHMFLLESIWSYGFTAAMIGSHTPYGLRVEPVLEKMATEGLLTKYHVKNSFVAHYDYINPAIPEE